MARLTHLLLVALAISLVAVEAHRPPPRRKSPPPPPPPKSPPPPPPPPPPRSPPPRSPPPPPPPPPPVQHEFPHTCSSNTRPNGDATYTSCTPFTVSYTGKTGNSVSFAVASKTTPASCTSSGGRNCRSMSVIDVKFVINARCRGVVSGISVTDSRSTYTKSPVYSSDEEYFTSPMESATTVRVVFPNTYTTSNVTGLRFTLNLNANFRPVDGAGPTDCGTNLQTLFTTPRGYLGGPQYAYYSADHKCCGTNTATA